MLRFSSILLGFCLWACSGERDVAAEVDEETGSFNMERFEQQFPEAATPYQLTDTALLRARDTTVIRNAAFAALIPDSLVARLAGKGKKVTYYPMAKISIPNNETYFIVRAQKGSARSALLVVFDKDRQFGAAFPFLVPDNDQATAQFSTLDAKELISRNVVRQAEENTISEGRDVYAFNRDARDFILIMTDLLDEQSQELINPIDTLPQTHKFAGDYGSGKRNLISIRDGRGEGQLTAFIHLEKNDGECTGEIKGDLLMTSTTTAVYRQGGDPCVLEMRFANNTVTLREVEGCGSRRGFECSFNGNYRRKKEGKPATNE